MKKTKELTLTDIQKSELEEAYQREVDKVLSSSNVFSQEAIEQACNNYSVVKKTFTEIKKMNVSQEQLLRPLIVSHARAIANYVMDSVLAIAMNKYGLENPHTVRETWDFPAIMLVKRGGQFLILDGQHRLKGLELAKSELEQRNNELRSAYFDEEEKENYYKNYPNANAIIETEVAILHIATKYFDYHHYLLTIYEDMPDNDLEQMFRDIHATQRNSNKYS